MLKTKIICTLGPACDDPEVMRELLRSGMSAARMNFSHGSHEEHLGRLTQFKRLRDEMGLHTAVLLDTRGPEIRIGTFAEKQVALVAGQSFTLFTYEKPGDAEGVSISYEGLPADVSVGQSILVDDGLIELRVLEIRDQEIHCSVVNGGSLSDRKSINIPGAKINLPALTEQDEKDILFAVEHGFDFIAVSFVRKAADILDVRRFLERNHGGHIKLIAKIENREGVDNIDDILRVSDGIMIARGDLGVEIPMDEIPVIQKMLIKRTYRSGKPVITATQMLDSMIRNPRPTRAEVTDVANAVYDGTSVIMLSGETASGKYPVEALRTMVKTAETTERSIHYWNRFESERFGMPPTVTNAISYASCSSAMNLGAAAILTVTKTGKTARMLSRFRPNCPIVAATTDLVAQRQLMLSWGVLPIAADEVHSTDELFKAVVAGALREGFIALGDLVVITAGVPVGISGTTNILKIETVGDILLSGKGLGSGKATGELFLAHTEPNKEEDIPDDCVLVAEKLTEDLLKFIRRVRALIIEGEDENEQAHTLAAALDIPVIVQAYGAMSTLREGAIATVDAKSGTVSRA